MKRQQFISDVRGVYQILFKKNSCFSCGILVSDMLITDMEGFYEDSNRI